MIGQELKLTAALVAANRNLESNLCALSERQPSLSNELSKVSIDLEWVFGRDSSLTARGDGQWWSGCSLPQRTAQTLLHKMELKGTVICLLSPSHAAQLRVTLDRMTACQALLAVVPDLGDLRVMLGCENFETEIDSGRLWFTSGECWPEELGQLLIANDGLPTPGQFVRTMLVEKEEMDEMIRAAQEVFSRETARRGQVVKSLFEKSAPAASDKICVIAPSTFRLWEDVGPALNAIAQAFDAKIIDPDQPCQASPIAFARAAADCKAVLLANSSRADLPADLPAQTPVITWMTGPRIPHYEPRGNDDLLLVADERWQQMAVRAGWPARNVKLANWPTQQPDENGTGLGIIADTVAIHLPEFTLTSQKILWESIARELSDDPFAAGLDAGAYLSRWLRHASIGEETVDRALFIDWLIMPAYQQGLARWLMKAGLDVKLFGSGWGEIEEFAGRHAGEIRNRDELAVAIDACAALVHAWPAAWVHPIEALGRPVLKRGSKTRESWLTEAKRLARGEGRRGLQNEPILSSETIRQAFRRVQTA
jgi:hypothetical protein